MKKYGIIAFVILLFGTLIATATKTVKNLAEKIKVTQLSFSYPQNINEVLKLFTDYFYSTVKVTISNYSDVKIKVQQIKLNLYTLKENLFLEQYLPLQSPITIQPHSNTTIELKYQVDYTDFLKLYEDNNLKGKIKDVVKSLIKNLSLNTQIIAKGFITVNNITININEKIDI